MALFRAGFPNEAADQVQRIRSQQSKLPFENLTKLQDRAAAEFGDQIRDKNFISQYVGGLAFKGVQAAANVATQTFGLNPVAGQAAALEVGSQVVNQFSPFGAVKRLLGPNQESANFVVRELETQKAINAQTKSLEKKLDENNELMREQNQLLCRGIGRQGVAGAANNHKE